MQRSSNHSYYEREEREVSSRGECARVQVAVYYASNLPYPLPLLISTFLLFNHSSNLLLLSLTFFLFCFLLAAVNTVRVIDVGDVLKLNNDREELNLPTPLKVTITVTWYPMSCRQMRSATSHVMWCDVHASHISILSIISHVYDGLHDNMTSRAHPLLHTHS